MGSGSPGVVIHPRSSRLKVSKSTRRSTITRLFSESTRTLSPGFRPAFSLISRGIVTRPRLSTWLVPIQSPIPTFAPTHINLAARYFTVRNRQRFCILRERLANLKTPQHLPAGQGDLVRSVSRCRAPIWRMKPRPRETEMISVANTGKRTA